MKKLGIIILFLAIITQGFGQEIYALVQQDERAGRSDRSENKEVVIGRNFLRINETDSMVNIRVGNRGLSILESLEGERSEVRIERYDDDQDEWVYREDDRERRRTRFRGKWSGVEFGFNNYTTSRSRQVIPDEIDYMTLHSGKSHNFNLNFAQLNLGLTRHVGFVTGLGLNWNNYRFDGNNNIVKGEGGQVEMYDPFADLKKSKLTTLYLTLPFLFEVQIPVNGSNHFNMSAGPIGAVKLLSHSKMVFEAGHKEKSNSDFNLNLLRYGATVRGGYSNVQFYGTYYLTPMFRSGDGPGGWDLYPFEVGIAFTFNN